MIRVDCTAYLPNLTTFLLFISVTFYVRFFINYSPYFTTHFLTLPFPVLNHHLQTRSGKIMRRILRKVAAGEEDSIGDVSTLADPSVSKSRMVI